MLYHAKEFTLSIGNSQCDCIQFGKGARPLIMIQGLNTRGIKGAALSLAYMYRIFAKEYTVYLFDRREGLPEEVTVRELAADVAAAMDVLRLTKADVLGVSQGGMIAQYLAMDRPDLVDKMVLVVTLSRNNPVVESVLHHWMEMTEQGRMADLVEDMAVKMYSPTYVRRYRPFMKLLTVLQTPKDVPRFLTLTRACLTCDAYEELDKIQCPVLVIGGRQDQVVDGEASVEIAEKLGCQIYMYEDLGHAAYEEAKDFNQKVLDFFKD